MGQRGRALDSRERADSRLPRLWIKGNTVVSSVHFLVQTDRFASLDLNVSTGATGIDLVLFLYIFFNLKNRQPLTCILWITKDNGFT